MAPLNYAEHGQRSHNCYGSGWFIGHSWKVVDPRLGTACIRTTERRAWENKPSIYAYSCFNCRGGSWHKYSKCPKDKRVERRHLQGIFVWTSCWFTRFLLKKGYKARTQYRIEIQLQFLYSIQCPFVRKGCIHIHNMFNSHDHGKPRRWKEFRKGQICIFPYQLIRALETPPSKRYYICTIPVHEHFVPQDRKSVV